MVRVCLESGEKVIPQETDDDLECPICGSDLGGKDES